jgi:hypothetical protein
MKAKTFAKFLVLFVALGLSSCGGDNKKGDTAPGGTINVLSNPSGNGTNQNVRTWGEFINSVAANQFGGASSENQVVRWNKYNNVSDLLNYSGDSGFNFDWCWGSDCFDDSSYGARRIGPINQSLPIYRNGTFAFDAELGNNLQELLNNMVARMRSGTNVKKCVYLEWQGLVCESEGHFAVGGYPSTRWYFEYGNRAYIIDTRLPLAANPVAILKKDTNEGFALQ